jgi:WXG100 family type VII secretion target
MATYTVNMGNVQQVATDMNTISTQIQTMLSDLNTQVQANLSQWSSTARDAYTAAQIKWNAAAQDMSMQAQKASASLNSINENYGAAETSGQNLWAQ